MLDALGLDRVRIVASDMGCVPALVFAARAPARVVDLTLAHGLLFDDEHASWEIAVMRRAGPLAFRLAPRVVYRQCLRTFLPGGVHLDPGLDADFWGALQRAPVREVLVEMCAAYDAALPGLPEHYWRVRCPVDLVWADDEAHFSVAHAERLAGLVPSAKVHRIDGGGHWVVWTRAAEVSALITRARTP